MGRKCKFRVTSCNFVFRISYSEYLPSPAPGPSGPSMNAWNSSAEMSSLDSQKQNAFLPLLEGVKEWFHMFFVRFFSCTAAQSSGFKLPTHSKKPAALPSLNVWKTTQNVIAKWTNECYCRLGCWAWVPSFSPTIWVCKDLLCLTMRQSKSFEIRNTIRIGNRQL